MQCRSCQTWNDSDERRCVRCGRRLHASAPRPAPEYTVFGAAAPQLEAVPAPESLPLDPPSRTGYQPSLFTDAAGGPKVIPIPRLIPIRSPSRPARSGGDSHAFREGAKLASPRSSPRKLDHSQQKLEFSQAGSVHHDSFHPHADRGAATQVEAVIYCDAPVALPTHRVIAAAMDLSMILIALGLFVATFILCGGSIVLGKQNVVFFGGVTFVLAIFYRFLWCLAAGDTPGMRFAGLRLVNFDGRAPDRDQRSLRQVASLLSFLSVGLGLVWALVDEESLTWHDHISKTFPTAG